MMVIRLLRKLYSKYKSHLQAKYLEIGDSIDCGISIRTDVPVNRKLVHIGEKSIVGGNFVFESNKGEIFVGNHTFIGGCTLISHSRITIGDFVQIAWGTYLYDHNAHSTELGARRHDIKGEFESLSKGYSDTANKDWSIVKSKPIVIEDDVWIGMNSIILKGVTLGRGSIVGAGSVVRRSVPPFCIVYGNPAKVIKFIYQEDEIEAVQQKYYCGKYEFIDRKKYTEIVNDYINKEV